MPALGVPYRETEQGLCRVLLTLRTPSLLHLLPQKLCLVWAGSTKWRSRKKGKARDKLPQCCLCCMLMSLKKWHK